MKLKLLLPLLLVLNAGALAHEGHDDAGPAVKPKKQVQVLRVEEPAAPEGKPEDQAAPKKPEPPKGEKQPAPAPKP